MTPALRVIDTGLRPADWNIAMTATLVERRARGEIDDTLRFHRYRPSVLIGHGQVADVVADLGYCRSNGIVVHRRVTGGGAVLMMPGMLAWDVVVGKRRGPGHGCLTQLICDAVAKGLTDLGVGAVFRPPNDIAVAGRKISGCAGFDAGAAAVLQGTVLIENDIGTMARALRLSGEELRRCMTCLRELTTGACDLTCISTHVADRVARALGRAAVWSQFHDGGSDAPIAAVDN